MFVAKSYEEAIKGGEAFIAANDQDAEVHYYLSRSYNESGDTEKALAHSTKADELSGEAPKDKYFYAQATQYEKLGNKASSGI